MTTPIDLQTATALTRKLETLKGDLSREESAALDAILRAAGERIVDVPDDDDVLAGGDSKQAIDAIKRAVSTGGPEEEPEGAWTLTTTVTVFTSSKWLCEK